MPVSEVSPSWFTRLNDLTFTLSKDGDLVSGPGIGIALAFLMNSSEGQTSRELQTSLNLSDKESSDFNDAMNAYAGSLQDSGLSVTTGLFMVWPILVTPMFQEEMARAYGADIVRLGSAGIGANRALNDYVRARSGGAIDQFSPKLERELVMVLASTQRFQAEWKQSPIQSEDGTLRFAAPNRIAVSDRLRVSVIPLAGDRFDLVIAQTLLPHPEGSVGEMKETVALARDAKEANLPLSVPTFSVTAELDLAKALEPVGVKSLWTGPVDMPQVAMELRGNQRIGLAKQMFRFTVGAEGIGVGELRGKPIRRPGERFFLLDRKTGLVVVTGRLD